MTKPNFSLSAYSPIPVLQPMDRVIDLGLGTIFASPLTILNSGKGKVNFWEFLSHSHRITPPSLAEDATAHLRQC